VIVWESQNQIPDLCGNELVEYRDVHVNRCLSAICCSLITSISMLSGPRFVSWVRGLLKRVAILFLRSSSCWDCWTFLPFGNVLGPQLFPRPAFRQGTQAPRGSPCRITHGAYGQSRKWFACLRSPLLFPTTATLNRPSTTWSPRLWGWSVISSISLGYEINFCPSVDKFL
jgi:hypothetical protein